MAANVPGLPELIDDGRWLAHRYDETADAVQFRFVPREAQREMTFLTDHEIGDAPLAVHGRAECLAEARKRELPTPRLIFHSAYCCSTLLARAFDIPGVSFGLKEPQILNDVVGLQLRRGDPRQVAAALDVALLLLARPERAPIGVCSYGREEPLGTGRALAETYSAVSSSEKRRRLTRGGAQLHFATPPCFEQTPMRCLAWL